MGDVLMASWIASWKAIGVHDTGGVIHGVNSMASAIQVGSS
jgi:hypothetical protein